MEQLLCDFTRRLLITTLMRSNTWMYGKPNQTIPDRKTCWWLKGLTDTSKFVENWKPQELMERSSKLKKPGNSWTLSFSHAILNFSPGVCVYHPCFPKDIPRPCISPMEGWNCQSRIQRTEETWLKPTLCSASILEIPHRHRNYPKQIRLDMLYRYPPIQSREPSKEASKQLDMYFWIFKKKHMLSESIIWSWF